MALIQGGYYLKARKIQESEIAHAPPHIREVWDHLLMVANHKGKTVHGRYIKRGQTFRSYKEIQDALHWMVGFRRESYTQAQLETSMKYLRKHEMITTVRTTRGLIITILNYDTFQNPRNYENHNESPDENHNENLNENPDESPTINKKKEKRKKKKETTRAKKLPDLYPLDQKHIAYYLDKGLLEHELNPTWEAFLAYHRGKGSKMVCWYSAWQTWCLNKQKWDAEKPQAMEIFSR